MTALAQLLQPGALCGALATKGLQRVAKLGKAGLTPATKVGAAGVAGKLGEELTCAVRKK